MGQIRDLNRGPVVLGVIICLGSLAAMWTVFVANVIFASLVGAPIRGAFGVVGPMHPVLIVSFTIVMVGTWVAVWELVRGRIRGRKSSGTVEKAT